jgi:hypothetical protein
MQYFIGYKEFSARKPFAPSLMVEFRKRLDMVEIQRIIARWTKNKAESRVQVEVETAGR